MSFLLYLAMLFPQQAPLPGEKPDVPAAVAPADAKPATAKPSDMKAEGQEGEKPAEAKPSEESSETPDDAEPVATGKTMSEIFEDLCKTGALGWMIRGGIFMWPILLCGVIAAGVIIERMRSLKMLASDAPALRNQVRQLLNEDRVEEALQACDRESGPVPAILGAGLRKFLVLRRLNYDPGKIEDQVVKAMEDYGVHIVAALEKHLPILATISSVAPMLGFLGTVSGMITSFDDIVLKLGEVNIVEAAAGGIGEALLTTLLGLVVGIPAFSAYNYFTSVINEFVLDVEETSTELIETVTLQMALESREAAGS